MEHPKKAAVAGLPDDILVEILSRLPVKEIHRSKCVSKRWRDLIADPFHRKKLPQTLVGFFHELGSFINLSGRNESPVDSSFTFLKKLPGIHNIQLRASCNGLLLFRHNILLSSVALLRELGYIVFNPATEQWAAVPSERNPADRCIQLNPTTLADRPIRLNQACLVFNPDVCPYFHLVIIYQEEGSRAIVHSYSSEIGVWRHMQIDWAEEVRRLGRWNRSGPRIRMGVIPPYADLLNGMLYFLLTDKQIAEVDLEGKTKRIIHAPPSLGSWVYGRRPLFIGQSQGSLYCINEEQWASDIPTDLSNRVHTRDSNDDSNLVSIWVLEDYDTQKWVLKHSVSCLCLFGSDYNAGLIAYDVVAIHPDNNNLVFIALYQEHKLISYGLNSKELRTVDTFQKSLPFLPYVPCFSDFLSWHSMKRS